MVSNDDFGSQFLQFSTQIGLDEIVIDEIEGSSTKRKPWVAFAVEEDTHLISSWLNISIDPIVDVGKGNEAFWLKVMENYNKFQGELRERAANQLKSQWQKINMGMQKFKGHYKQAVSLKKSGCTNNNVMLNAYVIWKKDEGTNFGLEHACRLLKDQSKWLENVTENFSKRMKISAFRAYCSSFNLETPV